MAKININCPSCKAPFKVDEANFGKKVRCQKCGEKFVISHPKDSNEIKAGNSQSQVEVAQPIQPQGS